MGKALSEFGNLPPHSVVFNRQRLNALGDDPELIKRCMHLALQTAVLISGERNI